MPNIDWQLIVVGLALTLATLYLARCARHAWRGGSTRRHGACGSCGTCSAPAKTATNQAAGFVPLETLRTSRNGSNDAS